MSWRDVIQTVKIAGVTVITLVGFAWVIWQFAASSYKAQVESYEAQVKSLEVAFSEATNTYKEILRRAEDLLEPQLWRVDTITFDQFGNAYESASNPLYMYGGLVRFKVNKIERDKKRITGTYRNEISGIPYHWDNLSPVTRVLDQTLTLILDKDKFEFSVNEQKYYFQVTIPDADSQMIVLNVYKLNPLFKSVR
jgi:hypothetical protein